MYEAASGQRLMSSYFRVGGLLADLPPGFEAQVQAFLAEFPSRLGEYEALLTQNPLWRQRTVDWSIRADAIALGVSDGLELAGAYDAANLVLRLKLPPDVPIGRGGDVSGTRSDDVPEPPYATALQRLAPADQCGRPEAIPAPRYF
jgi:NADH-quinone oxidoreductase subunit D